MRGDGERSAPPTPRRLARAREQGDVARSALAAVAASMLLAPLPLAVIATFERWFARALTSGGIAADHVIGSHFQSLALVDRAQPIGAWLPIALAWAASMTASIFAAWVSGSLSFAPAAMHPKWNRLIRGGGVRALAPSVDTLFSMLFALCAVAAIVIAAWPSARMQWESPASPSGSVTASLLPFALPAAWFRAAGAIAGIAAIEVAIARRRRMRRLMMTPREVRDERNEHEGRPEAKSRRRGIALRRSRRLRLAAVRTATAVVTNPTHVAVALRYAPPAIDVPVVVCSGADDAACAVRAEAAQHGVPVIESPQLARALFARVEVDDPIPEELFEAVAAIFAAILRVRGVLPGAAT
jgi:flagellar biosynthesis protein FlhB